MVSSSKRALVSAVALAALLSSACVQSASDVPIPSPVKVAASLPPSALASPGITDITSQSFATPLSVTDAERILTETEIFAYDLPSRGVQAYNRVFDRPDSRARFERLLTHGRWAGQLYAICGLGPLNPKAASVAARLAGVEEKIWVFVSDQVFELPVSTVVKTVQTNPNLAIGLRQFANEADRRFDPAGWLAPPDVIDATADHHLPNSITMESTTVWTERRRMSGTGPADAGFAFRAPPVRGQD